MAFPGAIGVIFHATDKVAVRPEFTFTRSTSETPAINASSWSIGTGVSALFYLSSNDRVQTYISPRFSYEHGSANAQGVTAISDTSSNATGFAGSFGAQYSPTSRFGVFGEIGIAYNHSKSTSSLSSVDVTSNSWGTRAGVGIIFYP